MVGGGPGGIEAARRLAARGFAVRLYERGDALGGQMRIWTAAPARAEVQRLIGWWERDLARRGVDVRLGVEATADVVVADAPAIVVDASGAVPLPHPALAVDGRRVFDVDRPRRRAGRPRAGRRRVRPRRRDAAGRGADGAAAAA